MDKINISLNPSYYCNFRCSFCYLTEEQLSDRTRLSLDRLAEMLDEIQQHYTVGHVDFYGGEVLLLPEAYLLGVRDLLHSRDIDDIVLVTNLSHVPAIVHDPAFEVSVSYDFSAREKADLVLNNIFQLSQPFTMLTLASREFLDTVTPDEYVHTLNMFTHLKGAEIKPYSSNQANEQNVRYNEYEDFVWQVITHPDRNFYFENKTQVIEAVEGRRNAFSDDHIYITPKGTYAVLEFDDRDNEFFLDVDGLAGYQQWAAKEKSRVNTNPICASCPYVGHCLSEHLREVTDLTHSCNGFRGLLDKWQDVK